MSVGKILRKIVKRWLKKDSESGIVEPTEYELFAETKVPLATGQLDDCEPCLEDCVFCIERDGTYGGGGDLNRNVHISDHEMGFSSGSSIGGFRKCRVDEWNCELSETSYSSSCPLHGLSNFMGDSSSSTEFPFDATTCHSSQSPVPLCVCETCYIFVSSHLSLRLPSKPFVASPRTAVAVAADAAAGQPLCGDLDKGCWSNQCPTTGQLDSSKGSSTTLRFGMTTKGMTKPTDCNEDSSISVTSNRRFHSIVNQKSPSCSMEQLPKTTTTTVSGGGQANLPQSVHVSLDGEEGFVEGQRRLRSINRWEDAAHKSFRPPPNKTICHVAK